MKATYQTWKGSLLWSEIQAVLNTGKDLVVYDLETTGLSPQNDRIIEIAAVKYGVAPSDGDYVFTEKGVYHQLINPGVPLPQTITEITGLTDAALADKPLEADCVDEIALFFDGCILSGYNITTFDNGFMTEYFARFGYAFDAAYVVDGIKMARNRLRYKEDVENFKLTTVGAYYGISFNAHSALEDTRTTSKLVQIFVHEYAGESKSKDDKPAEIGAMRPLREEVRAFCKQWNGGCTWSTASIYCWRGRIFPCRSQIGWKAVGEYLGFCRTLCANAKCTCNDESKLEIQEVESLVCLHRHLVLCRSAGFLPAWEQLGRCR